jgi:hypothetical protein
MMHTRFPRLGLLTLCLLLLAACATTPTPPNPTATTEVVPTARPTLGPTPTAAPPTAPPPPPQVPYTPVEEDWISPLVIHRFPGRGETMPSDGTIELIFDRPMNQEATAGAFTLQKAGEQPQSVEGQISWPDARIMHFAPTAALERNAVYDTILTQAATDETGAPLAEPFVFRFNTPGNVEVSQVIPANGTTNVETDATITVIFNRPMVPLTSLEEMEGLPHPLEFDPPVAGQGEWLNTSIYVFTPDEDLPGGAEFRATVKAGLADAVGETSLPQDFTWSFTTHPPEVVWATPSDGATLVPIETPIQVTFNQPIDPQSAQANFELVAAHSGAVQGDFLVSGSSLIFTPTSRLAFNTEHQVTLAAGVTSLAGDQGMVNPYVFRFTTVPLPEIVATMPADGEEAPPYTGFSIIFNTPINPDTVMAHVSMTPPLPITPTDVYTSYSPWDNSFHLSFGAKPSTDYQVRITPGIEDPYGNTTQEDLTINFRTAPLDPQYELRIPDFIATYDAGLPAKIVVGAVNVNQVNFRLYRLEPNEIVKVTWDRSAVSPNNLVRAWQEQLATPLNAQAFHPIDLVEGGGPLEPGLYYLDTDSPQVEEQEYYYNHDHFLLVSETNLTLKTGPKEALVWATDLESGAPLPGLAVDFYDSEMRPLGSATTDNNGLAGIDLQDEEYRRSVLAVVMPAGNRGLSAVSDGWAYGVSPYEFGLNLAYDLPDFAAHIYTDRPIYRPGQTVYFKGTLRAEDDVEFNLPGLNQVHLTVRDAAYEIILDEQVEMSQMGTFNGELQLDANAPLGGYVIGIDFNNQYFEHYFQVAAYRPPEFEVTVTPAITELQRGDDLAATINANYFFGGPLAGANLTWNLLAEPYTFEPAQLGNYTFRDDDDPYICFYCWWWYAPPEPELILSGSSGTGAAGQLALTLSGQEIDAALDPGSYRLTLEATATGPDNQYISGRSSVVAHKGDYYIGLSPQEHVADAGQETAVDLVTVDWAAERLAGKNLSLQIIRYEWENKFIQEGGGGYWSYEQKKELVQELNVTTDNRGEAVARFTPPEGGSYQIVAQDAATLVQPQPQDEEDPYPRSPIRSSIFVWVAGKEDVSWRRENHDRITLISDKGEYAPGETAEILIPSPFAGPHYALITVERGRIIRQEVIEMTSNSQVYRLPIVESYAPNIYVSVVLVQGRAGAAEGEAPRLADYKLGILPLDVTPTAQKLQITLTPNVEQAQPDQAITYTLQATNAQGQPVAAEFSLDLVDKAILSLQPRQPEAIVAAYYHRRDLAISTASGLAVSANQFLLELAEDLGLEQQDFYSADDRSEGGAGAIPPSPPMAAAPVTEAEESVATDGLAAKEANQAQLPPDIAIREDFSDTAYWNPVVTTDQAGEAQVTLTLPDNLTTWVMRGVGLTGETLVGEGTVELLSTKPLLIRPVAPRFFVVEDRAQLAANVTNNTTTPLETQVILQAAGLEIDPETPAAQTVTIPARSETKVTWEVTVQDVITTELLFAAISGDYNDAAKPRLTTGPDGSLLVFRYTTPDIVGTAGQLIEAGSRTEVIALPPNFDERRGELSLQLDPSLAAGMRDGLTYLEHYEYECTEQTVSRFLPNMLTYNALQSLGIENEELAQRLPGLIEEGLGKLYLQQHEDGGWGWWQDDESNVHLTAYVVFALTKAKQTDVAVQADTPEGTGSLERGQQFLLDHLQQTRDLKDTFDANRHAFVLYVLAEDGQAPAEALGALFADREKLAHYARAYLALALNMADAQGYKGDIQTLLSDLNNAAILSATGAHWEEANYDWWAMNTDTRSTAVILDALARLDPQNELIPNVVRWLMVARKAGIWETTQETAWSLIALTDWMATTGELDAAYDYSVFLNEAERIAGSATKENVQESVKLKIPLADLLVDAGNRLTLARTDGNGRLYYSAHLKVYLPVEEVEPADRGIIVSRRYTLQSCRAAQEAAPEEQRVPCPELNEAQLGDVIRVDLTIIAPNDLYYVVVEDPLPAGAEGIDTGLATTSLLAMDPTLSRNSPVFYGEDGEEFYSPYWWWWNWYSRSEMRDEKVVLFADYLPKGTYEYSYTMRATLPGDYHVLPTLATEFYFPEVFGRSDGRLLSVGE